MAREADLAVDAHARRSRRRADEADPESAWCSATPSRPQRKSRCHHERRNSPSVMPCKPNSCCFSMRRSISRSSTASRPAASSAPSACRRRASRSGAGRNKLPTWSARNGGVAFFAIVILGE